MKNREFYKLFKKSRSQPDSGFTLYELLVGLVMGTIVVGALGFGLAQMLRTTQDGAADGKTRSETTRAFGFIADEVKAAQAMEITANTTTADLQTADDPTTPEDESIAPSFVPPGGGTPILALQVPGVTQRVIYSVAPSPGGSAWNGPSVIYRWGPNLNATGGYTDPTNTANWQNEALIDGVDNTAQPANCDLNEDGTAEPITYQGFYACVVDNDGDGILEDDSTVDKNSDGEVTADDGADTDGVSITAQLYFAGQNNGEVFVFDSQAVARSRTAPLRKPELQEQAPVFFTSLNPQFGRPGCWTVRNDFGAGSDSKALPGTAGALENTMTWVHEDNRQPQPLNIDKSKPFTMVASAFGGIAPGGCIARGNVYKTEWDTTTSDYEYYEEDDQGNKTSIIQQTGETDEDFEARLAAAGLHTDGSEKINTYKEQVSHTIYFDQEATYNGVDGAANDNPDVAGDGSIYMFRNDSIVPDIGGYDANNNGVQDPGDQPSIRKVLQDKGLVDSNGKVIESKLESNQRIVVFEIGQDKPAAGVDNPGYDLQDSMFIMTFDDFTFNS